MVSMSLSLQCVLEVCVCSSAYNLIGSTQLLQEHGKTHYTIGFNWLKCICMCTYFQFFAGYMDGQVVLARWCWPGGAGMCLFNYHMMPSAHFFNLEHIKRAWQFPWRSSNLISSHVLILKHMHTFLSTHTLSPSLPLFLTTSTCSYTCM